MPACCDAVHFDVAASGGRYAIDVVPGHFAEWLAEAGDRLVIADAFFADRLAAAGIDALLIEADEGAKDIDRMAPLLTELRVRGATRETMLVAIGGGVVQDIVGFVASVYMRGVRWTYMPTTLLAMTDSCIGGKSSINVGACKNLVGTFHPPVAVRIDPELTGSLTVEQRAAGLIEAAKICFCRGEATFDAYLAADAGVRADAGRLAAVAALSLKAKSWFIEIDEFDRGERLLLNFGHTFGHAIESASDFAISHGIAVGLGMLAALDTGRRLGRAYGDAPRVGRLERHVRGLLAQVAGLEGQARGLNVDALMRAFASDKKHGRAAYALITLSSEGLAERVALPREEATDRMLRDVFAAMIAEPALAVSA